MRKDRRQLLTSYQYVFNSEHGKMVWQDLQKRCPLLMNSIQIEKGIDTNKLCYLEGQRSVLMYIFRMLNTNPYEERGRFATEEGAVL